MLVSRSLFSAISALSRLIRMAIRQITIIGTGLIGGSFGLALKKQRFAAASSAATARRFWSGRAIKAQLTTAIPIPLTPYAAVRWWCWPHRSAPSSI